MNASLDFLNKIATGICVAALVFLAVQVARVMG